jgi:predicted RNase H-like nuclease (RuvC/YqgF family)
MKDLKIKKWNDFLNEEVSWSKKLFGKTIKELFDDIYSELNPVLLYKKMERYHQELKNEVERGEKELEEKKKAVEELENKLKERIENKLKERKNGNK